MISNSAFWRDLEAQFRALPGATRLAATVCEGQWSLCGGPSDERQSARLRKLFRSLARRAAIATGAETHASALDSWLGLLREESPHFHAVYVGPQKDGIETDDEAGHIENLALASAEYCVERATCTFELEVAAADGGTPAGLRRDRYPLRYCLYDHSHQPVADLEAELDYWKTHVWRGFNDLMEEYERLGMATWPDRLKKLKRAVGGLSYDLAVLQANDLLARGLRGEEAMRAHRDASAALQEQVASSSRGWCERLQISCEDDGVRVHFRRVADDLQQLLRDLPPIPAPEDSIDIGGPAKRKAFIMPLLTAKGWSILDWAIASGVDGHTASDYLKGATKPYRSTRKKLADSLGVEVEALPV
jgi:lambda repressor-like predicted transcriptional regulator